MLDYDVFSQYMSGVCRYTRLHFNVFIPKLVTTGLDWFFAVLVQFPVLLKKSKKTRLDWTLSTIQHCLPIFLSTWCFLSFL